MWKVDTCRVRPSWVAYQPARGRRVSYNISRARIRSERARTGTGSLKCLSSDRAGTATANPRREAHSQPCQGAVRCAHRKAGRLHAGGRVGLEVRQHDRAAPNLRGVAPEPAARHVERVGRSLHIQRPADTAAEACRDAERRRDRIPRECDLHTFSS